MDALLRAPSFDNILLKSHEASETSLLLAKHGAARLICTVRPIADAVASWIETFAFDEASTVHQFSRWLELFEKLKPVSLVLPFAMIDSTPIEACSHIARHLGVVVSEDELGAIAGELDKTENKMKFDALSADDP
ncbi:MAG: hypothetical protein Q8R82_19725, partial [Hyphomonadaceae bacterium]|nr:hypothetical protein [Hyphomonadaceae bacterium]